MHCDNLVEMSGVEPESKICPQQNSFTNLASLLACLATLRQFAAPAISVYFATATRRTMQRYP